MAHIKIGTGAAAYFADVEIFFDKHRIKIPGWPVWRNENGGLEPDLPGKPSMAKGTARKWFPVVQLDPELQLRAFTAIRQAVRKYEKERAGGFP